MNTLLLTLGIFLISTVQSYNVVVLFHYPIRSTFNALKVLLEELVSRGHNVTVISQPVATSDKPSYNEIILESVILSDIGKTVSDLNTIENKKLHIKYLSPMLISSFSDKLCDSLYKNKEVQELYKNNVTYDVVLLNVFETNCIYQLAKQLNCPIIGYHATLLMPWGYERFALPLNPAVVPNFYLPFSTKMSFFERVENALVTWGHNLYYRIQMFSKDKEIIKNHFGIEEANKLEDLVLTTSLFLMNTHYSVNLPRAMVPNVVEVGGIHIGKRKALPKVS